MASNCQQHSRAPAYGGPANLREVIGCVTDRSPSARDEETPPLATFLPLPLLVKSSISIVSMCFFFFYHPRPPPPLPHTAQKMRGERRGRGIPSRSLGREEVVVCCGTRVAGRRAFFRKVLTRARSSRGEQQGTGRLYEEVASRAWCTTFRDPRVVVGAVIYSWRACASLPPLPAPLAAL